MCHYRTTVSLLVRGQFYLTFTHENVDINFSNDDMKNKTSHCFKLAFEKFSKHLVLFRYWWMCKQSMSKWRKLLGWGGHVFMFVSLRLQRYQLWYKYVLESEVLAFYIIYVKLHKQLHSNVSERKKWNSHVHKSE